MCCSGVWGKNHVFKGWLRKYFKEGVLLVGILSGEKEEFIKRKEASFFRELIITFFIILFIVFLVPNAHAVTITSLNASAYTLISGNNITGSLDNVNLSNGVTFDFNESASHSPFALACATDNNTVPVMSKEFCQQFNSTDGTFTNKSSNEANPKQAINQWIVVKANPFGQETIIASQDNNSDLHVQIWNGSSFTSTSNMTLNVSTTGARNFDVTFENRTGRIMIAYGVNVANTIAYRLWNQSSWSNERWITLANLGGAINYIALANDPSSNNITMVANNATLQGGIQALRWNGAIWGGGNMLIGNTTAGVGLSDCNDAREECFALAADNESNFLLTWQNSTASSTGNLFYKMWWANGTIDASQRLGPAIAGNLAFEKIVQLPNTYQLLACFTQFLGVTTSFICIQWRTHIGWGTIGVVDLSIENALRQTSRVFDVVPNVLLNGFVAPYINLKSGNVTLASCTSQANCNSGIYSIYTPLNNQSENLIGSSVFASYDIVNTSHFLVLWGNQNTSQKKTAIGRWYCDSTTCAVINNTARFRQTFTATEDWQPMGVDYDRYSNYTQEFTFNSTNVNSSISATSTLYSLNSTIQFNATYAGNYSVFIYNWTSAAWVFAQSKVMTVGTQTFLNASVCQAAFGSCLIVGKPEDFIKASSGVIQIDLNVSTHNNAFNVSTQKVDYVNFNVTSNAQSSFQWATVNKTSGTQYNHETILFFANFTDDNGTASVVMTLGDGASQANYTMSAYNGSSTNGVWNYNFSFLGATSNIVDYTANFTAYDGVRGSLSSNLVFSIIQNTSWNSNHTINNTAGDLSGAFPLTARLRCMTNTDPNVTVTEHRNSTQVATGLFIDYTENPSYGDLNWTCLSTSNANYSAKTSIFYTNTSKGNPTFSLFLNQSASNKTYNSGQTVNASANKTIAEGNLSLYRNTTAVAFGILLAEEANKTSLIGETFNYTACFPASQNYSASCTTFFAFFNFSIAGNRIFNSTIPTRFNVEEDDEEAFLVVGRTKIPIYLFIILGLFAVVFFASKRG